MKIFIFITLVVLSVTSTAIAQTGHTATWIASATISDPPKNWDDNTNWSDQILPVAGDNVVIQGNAICNINIETPELNNFYINPSKSIKFDNNGEGVLQTAWFANENGNINGTKGTLYLTGNALFFGIASTSNFNIDRLVISSYTILIIFEGGSPFTLNVKKLGLNHKLLIGKNSLIFEELENLTGFVVADDEGKLGRKSAGILPIGPDLDQSNSIEIMGNFTGTVMANVKKNDFAPLKNQINIKWDINYTGSSGPKIKFNWNEEDKGAQFKIPEKPKSKLKVFLYNSSGAKPMEQITESSAIINQLPTGPTFSIGNCRTPQFDLNLVDPEIKGDSIVCESDQNLSYCAPELGCGCNSTYWSCTGNGSIDGSDSDVCVILNALGEGTFELNLLITSDCLDTTLFKTVTVKPKPHFTVLGPPGHTLETNEIFTFISTDNTADNYVWDVVNDGNCLAYFLTSCNCNSITVNSGPNPGRFYIKLREGLGSCDSLFVGGVTVTNPSPVEMISFTSNSDKNKVTLNWQTASELNNSGFEIERSIAKGQKELDWEKVGFLLGHGTVSTPMDYSFNDLRLMSGRYKYRLKQIDFNGNFEYFNLSDEVVIGTPEKFSLSQNYPNPFNPNTKIDFDLPNDGIVKLKVFDNSGKEVAVLVNEFRQAGYHTMEFNAANLSSGVYFYRIEFGNIVATKKMLLLK